MRKQWIPGPSFSGGSGLGTRLLSEALLRLIYLPNISTHIIYQQIAYGGKLSWGPNFVLCYLQLIRVFIFVVSNLHRKTHPS